MNKKKEELLKDYIEKETNPCIQFECFMNEEESDCFFLNITRELMTGDYEIRIVISPNVKKEAIIRALQKIIDWLIREDKTDDVLKD